MMTAKIFENGNSQAVRLPKECRFQDKEVLTHKIGDVVLLMPKNESWESFLEGLDMFSEDFMADGRDQGDLQHREAL